jgi:hypothetical protein
MRAVSSIAFSQIFEAEGAGAAFVGSMTPVFTVGSLGYRLLR